MWPVEAALRTAFHEPRSPHFRRKSPRCAVKFHTPKLLTAHRCMASCHCRKQESTIALWDNISTAILPLPRHRGCDQSTVPDSTSPSSFPGDNPGQVPAAGVDPRRIVAIPTAWLLASCAGTLATLERGAIFHLSNRRDVVSRPRTVDCLTW